MVMNGEYRWKMMAIGYSFIVGLKLSGKISRDYCSNVNHSIQMNGLKVMGSVYCNIYH